MFFIFGILSLFSIMFGLFFRDVLTEDIANILLFGGVIIGCLNVVFTFFKK